MTETSVRTSTHELKTWPDYFEAVWAGDKTFEIRYDDRGYQRGDVVVLREWDRSGLCSCLGRAHDATCGRYTGRQVRAEIGHITASTPARGQQRGFSGNGYVVFSLCDPKRVDGRPAVSPADVARLQEARL